ncbi:hemopexin repeat-containing protein [Dactylosporangium sp. NPDC006015]|uniref:hemopexin repeat-containing protein n=1 Tax=Dactylosporangium sp. NPDC006015 TaxID=3154576 RepID=UPI00339F38C2
MHPSLPDYQKLFGDLDFRGSDASRSVYSPAAYLADLLQLLTGSDLPGRRPDLRDVRLDGANSYTEVPYLDIVNGILADELDPDGGAHDALAGLRHPFGLPFSLRHERLRRLLHHLGTTPLELYRRFAVDEQPDVVVREYLGLNQDEADLYSTVLDDAAVLECYGLRDGETFTDLAAVDRFRQAVGLTHEELLALLHGDLAEAERAEANRCFIHHDDEVVTLDTDERRLVRAGSKPVPVTWFERVNRFVRLARRAGLRFQDLDLVLRSCCGNVLDATALRRIATLRFLQQGYDLPLDVVVALVAPVNALGVGDGDTPLDLFNRVFNVPFVATERTVLRGAAHLPAAYAGLPELAAPHDLLEKKPTYRQRTGVADADVQTIVTRYRDRSADGVSGPLDRGRAGVGALTLLYRVGQLTTALNVTAEELFDILDALQSDPSLRRHPAFPVLLSPAEPVSADVYDILAGTDVEAGLWLLQTLLGVVRWAQATGLDSRGLLEVLGVGPERRGPAADEERAALLDALRAQFETVQLTPDAFRSARFGPRAAQVIHDVVAGAEDVGSPVLRLTPGVRDAAYAAVTDLGRVTADDFRGIGLDERFATKIHTNLVLRGYLDPSGTLDAATLPETPEELWLTGDFGAYRDAIAADLAAAVDRAGEDEPAAFYPSDLARYSELTAAEQAELYDNLVFNGRIDAEGRILASDDDAVDPVDADLADLVWPVYERLLEVADRFPGAWITLDPAVFADVPLTDQQRAALLESLRFNGYLDDEGAYTDPVAALGLTLPELTLDVAFHPHRRQILDAIQGQLTAALTAMNTLTPDDFRDLGDDAAAQRVAGVLDAGLLVDGRIPDDAVPGLTDPAAVLTLAGFTEAENLLVLQRLVEAIRDGAPFRVDVAAVDALGFTAQERDDLLRVLVEAGDLTPGLTVPADRLNWFGHVHHALDFALPGLTDYSRDVFFLLHAVAVTVDAAADEVVAVLTAREAAQRAAVFATLQDALGVPAATAEAICAAVVGGAAETLDLLVAPALDDPFAAAADPDVRRAVRRIRGFAALAARLGLGADEVAVAFQDQDLTGKFAEPLTLPPGVDRIDALLESPDGDVYLFRGRGFWRYEPGADTPADPRPRALTELSDRFGGLASVDAAFTDADGTAWIVGRDDAGTSRTFVRPLEHTRWTPRTQAWGTVRNAFSDGTRIDAAFVDEEGRTYLFRGDQYVRYSGPGYAAVDEGYPRRLGEWWEGEQRRPGDAPLPPRFRSALDAAFLGHDGVTYLFSGDQFVALGGPADRSAAERPIAGTWGTVVNNLATADRVDAAYVDGSALYVFSGDQVVRHSDSVENDGLRADDGYPRRIAAHFDNAVPAVFEPGVDAALAEPGGGVIHLFRNGKTAAVGAPDASVVPTAQRWGVLGPVLPSGTVDAALLGLDGRTYLFSGGQYLRYTGADYTTVDPGHPRAIPDDWGGLCRVDAAFVMDGATYVFGTGGKLFDLPLDEGPRTAWSRDRLAPVHRADLDEGRLPGALRDRLAEHGIPVASDAAVSNAGTATGAQWRLTATDGLSLTLRKAGRRLQVHVTPDSEDPSRPYWEEVRPRTFFVKYSTRDYTTPDAGYPRPMTENWWNLPDDLIGGEAEAPFARVDAVFTAADGRIHLFAGGQFVVFDAKRRWWSAPRPIADGWDSLPFGHVDAAFVGADGRTYVFSGPQYVRYTDTYTRVDDRFPARITSMWGTVANTIARTGRVDAALVVQRPATDDLTAEAPLTDGSLDTPDLPVDGRMVRRTYLFSGGQYVRYTDTAGGTRPATVDLGYPRQLAALREEPGFEHLAADLTRVDAAFADRGNVYLYSGRDCHVVSLDVHRRLTDVARADVACALVEDGTVYLEHPEGWHRYSSLEGTTVASEPALPRGLRTVPAEYRTGLDAVLAGTDGTTYLFKGATCYNTTLDRAYPLAEEWGRPRNTIYHDNAVDTAFVAANGKTYVFSGDQFVVYDGPDYLEAEVTAGPLPIAEHFAGLRRVALAYVRDGVTHLFEPPDSSGLMRLVTYSGKEYDQPDDAEPRFVDAEFWGVPQAYRPAGFTAPDAVLFTGDATLLLTGGTVVQYDEVDRVWSAPRPLDRIWRGIGDVEELTTAFTGRDGATYFFFAHEFARYQGRAFTPRQPIQDRWGRTRNTFLNGSGVDAAFVHQSAVSGAVTYLFAGEQYVRYSTSDYRWVDPGYPRPIAGNLSTEEPFAGLPAAVEDELVARAGTGGSAVLDAVVAGGRNTYLFAGRTCHVVSAAPAAVYDIGGDISGLGQVRNTIADRRRVDAALVTAGYTYLFSGDQYVRYTGADYTRVDDGYPRTIAGSLAEELDVERLPEEFHTGIDAAMRAPDGWTYLFAGGGQSLRFRDGTAEVTPIAGAWGAVRNDLTAAGGPRAAFVAPGGELYAFAGGQYVRYALPPVPAEGEPVPAATAYATVDDGYPRLVHDAWGALPTDFEAAIDGAFTLRGHTYLCSGGQYVRYAAGRYDTDGPASPQAFADRWADVADYRLGDLRTVTRFAALVRTHRAGGVDLAAALAPAARPSTDLYRSVADLFGWDVDELRWCRRNSRFLTDGADDEDRFELEFLLELVELFGFAGPLGAGPSKLRADVWTRLHPAAGRPADAALDAAAAALTLLLARKVGADRWPALARTLHDELNLALRDALVGAVLARDPGPAAHPRTARDLFERYLIDVEMGEKGMTSRVREAIAAVQLYVHRYLLNLEPADGGEEQRLRVKQWWTWMRNYRVWEANRKVFLYPENYLRPELRDTKTPAFEALERDLLQGEITAQGVERAYKRYLDEYTEVSRLTIAGGYVYTKDQLPDGPRRLVLFGRTKTDPRRYYFRRAEFGSREKLSATWEPWQPVGVRIDADLVHPVHAFGRVFVFWTVVEPVADDDPASGTVVARSDGAEQHVTASAKSTRVRIAYSFQNLNGEWVPAQELGTGPAEAGTIGDVQLLVLPRIKPDTGRMSVVVSCTYTATPPTPAGAETPPEPKPAAVLYELNPELYAERIPVPPKAVAGTGTTPAEVAASIIASIMAAAAAAAGLPLPAGPAAADADTDAALAELATAVAAAAAAKAATADRVAQIFLDQVQPADVVRFDAPTGAESWPWFSVDHKGGSFLCRPVTIEQVTVAPVKLSTTGVRFPSWSAVDAAVELPGGTATTPGTQLFFSTARNRSVVVPPAGRIPGAVPIGEQWGLPRTVLPAANSAVDAVLVRGEHTFVFSGSQYVRFTGTPFGKIDKGYPRAILGNTETLPQWDRVDVAFTLPGNVEVFLNQALEQVVTVTDGKLGTPASWKDHWVRKHLGGLDAVMVTDTYVFLFAGDRYARLDHTKKPNKGNWFDAPDKDYPRPIAGNPDRIPTDVRVDAAVWRNGTAYYFDNTDHRYAEVPAAGARTYRATYAAPSAIATSQIVDAAWVGGGKLYLTRAGEYVRYTLNADNTVPDCIDDGYPKPLAVPVDTVLRRGADLYVFSGPLYTKMPATQEPSKMPGFRPVAGAWGELPAFDSALTSSTGLYMFVGDTYLPHDQTLEPPRPYERTALPFEIVRLTTGTASDLNRKLLSGGMPALLDLSTQETDEVAFSTDPLDVKAIRVKPELVDPDRLPSGSHLDFRSANGLYYWEIFFHAPLLIANALNGAQRFEDARRWYEYIFDPTHPTSYWRFLPFLTIDPAALADSLTAEFVATGGTGLDVGTLAPSPTSTKLGPALAPVVIALRTLAPAVAEHRDPRTAQELAALGTVKAAATHKRIAGALAALLAGTPTAAQRAAVAALEERTLIAADLGALFEANGDEEDLLKAYREDPFDPHAIAALRPVAYRRAVVMGYVDNLLDWADMLFRQYTPESVDEARMLYVLAYDLLGERPERLGVRLLPQGKSLAELGTADLTGYFSRGGVMLDGPGEVHAGVGDAYFSIPENSVFLDYWTRVEDRLHKIRQSLDILGISRPLPLFAPPIDPMALVQAVASGAGLDQVTAAAAAQPPHYRFAAVYRRAQEVVDKLGQLGSDLLSVLERGSAEELSLLQNRQEHTILTMSLAVKEAQVRIAEEGVAELTAGRVGAQERAAHYDALIATGMTALERAQIATMSLGATMHMSSSVLQIASAISHALPQIKMGPFIMGAEAGGDQAGSSLDSTAQILQSLGEGFQVIGEVLGVSAQYERMSQDWTLQLATARNDLEQLEHRIATADQQLSIARREADIQARQLEHSDAVATFLQDRFTNAELYGWMAARLSGMYFQAYSLAYDLAKAAERAYQFEQGVTDEFIRPTYWESRRNGLLAGQSLALDLQQLGKAQLDGDARPLEITRQVSLLDTDPVALLRLRTAGSADFALSEALFDRDFPGHFRRQIRTVTVTFLDAEGQPVGVNATLTQLSNKTVLAPDPAAVKHLLDPKGSPPDAIRADWRASQRIALSQVDYGKENNGLFELRYDDERYLPFEGTGAVSTWRLERSAHRAPDVYDVLVTVKYTAEYGGDPFAAAVKGMLKPFTAARFFDVAREFPEQWEDFVGNGASRLVLPFATGMFPDMAGRRITGIVPAYELTNGTPARLVLNGDPKLTLTEATLLPTPGLTVRDDGPGWAFALDGDKADLGNVGLVLTYQARVQ